MDATRDTTRKKRGWCRKETLEKERWLACGGGAGRSKRAVFFTPPPPPPRPLVGRWVVERGLPRLLSVSRISGLYRAPFSSSLSFSSRIRSPSLSLFPCRSISFSLSASLPRLFCLVPLSHFCPVPRSTLATLLFRDLVSAAAFLFFCPFRPICSPSPLSLLRSFPLVPPASLPTSPLFRRPLHARAFPASPTLRSDRLRIHCEIDRPKRVPEWPERTRMQQKGMGWHMRSGRFKGTPQERGCNCYPVA